jgi:hypothetical protein
MKTPEPSQQPNGPLNKKAGSGKDSLRDTAMTDFASALDDFLDEEVVDNQGAPIGTLACYWKSVSGLLIFLGIKVEGQESVRVVPGRRSQVDDRQACIRLGFEAEDIESAPHLDCDNEMDATFERSVCEHFGLGEVQPHDALRYFARGT